MPDTSSPPVFECFYLLTGLLLRFKLKNHYALWHFHPLYTAYCMT
jgi:hypothetical protein